jgi:GNAT superfamily N-acetyltransferase
MEIDYRLSPAIDNDALNHLLADAWPDHARRDFSRILPRSLGYVCAFAGNRVIGFVNVAWDGDMHAFLLDPMVQTEFRRRGIGTALVRHAANLARSKGAEWLHVDYEPHLEEFYAKCGFKNTRAGLINLTDEMKAG